MPVRKSVGKSWADKVQNTATMDSMYLNILVYGGSGAGKTAFMGTCPNPFFIAAEPNGVLTLKGKNKEGFPYYPLSNDEKVYDTVMAIIKSAQAKTDGFENIETICLDSIWKLNAMLLEESKETITSNDGYAVWGDLLTKIQTINNALLSLPYHYVASVGEKIKLDELTKAVVPGYNMSGSFADQLPYEFDINLYMVAKTVGARTQYMTYTLPENKRNAKSRFKLPREMQNCTFPMLMEKINKSFE